MDQDNKEIDSLYAKDKHEESLKKIEDNQNYEVDSIQDKLSMMNEKYMIQIAMNEKQLESLKHESENQIKLLNVIVSNLQVENAQLKEQICKLENGLQICNSSYQQMFFNWENDVKYANQEIYSLGTQLSEIREANTGLLDEIHIWKYKYEEQVKISEHYNEININFTETCQRYKVFDM